VCGRWTLPSAALRDRFVTSGDPGATIVAARRVFGVHIARCEQLSAKR